MARLVGAERFSQASGGALVVQVLGIVQHQAGQLALAPAAACERCFWAAGAGRASALALTARPALCTQLPLPCRRVQSLFHSVQLNVNNPHFLIMQGRITKASEQQGGGDAQACRLAAGLLLHLPAACIGCCLPARVATVLCLVGSAACYRVLFLVLLPCAFYLQSTGSWVQTWPGFPLR